MKTFLKEGRSRWGEGGLLMEILAGGDQLAPYFENLAGEKAAGIGHLGIGEYIQVSNARWEAADLTIDWIGVGMTQKVCENRPPWGQPPSERLPCLRFNRAADHLSEFFDENEPYKYRIQFRLATEGLRFVAIERLLEGGDGWQVCDLTTDYLVLVALHEILPRINQQGE